MNIGPRENLSRARTATQEQPGHQNLKSTPRHKMEGYNTIKVSTTVTSGKHAGEASTMAGWKLTAGLGVEERRKMFREVKKMKADKLRVSLCQVKGELETQVPRLQPHLELGLLGLKPGQIAYLEGSNFWIYLKPQTQCFWMEEPKVEEKAGLGPSPIVNTLCSWGNRPCPHLEVFSSHSHSGASRWAGVTHYFLWVECVRASTLPIDFVWTLSHMQVHRNKSTCRMESQKRSAQMQKFTIPRVTVDIPHLHSPLHKVTD